MASLCPGSEVGRNMVLDRLERGAGRERGPSPSGQLYRLIYYMNIVGQV